MRFRISWIFFIKLAVSLFFVSPVSFAGIMLAFVIFKSDFIQLADQLAVPKGEAVALSLAVLGGGLVLLEFSAKIALFLFRYSFCLTIKEDRVVWEGGIAPWNKGSLTWDGYQLREAIYQNGFVGWLFNYGDLIIKWKEGSEENYVIQRLGNARKACDLINELIRNAQSPSLTTPTQSPSGLRRTALPAGTFHGMSVTAVKTRNDLAELPAEQPAGTELRAELFEEKKRPPPNPWPHFF